MDSWHRAHGITIRSAFPLPEVPTTESGTADLTITDGFVDRAPDDTYVTAHPDGGARLSAVVGTLRVQADEIVVDPDPEVNPRVLRRYLLGPAIGLAMHLSGRLVMHGSAVAVGGHAAIFTGSKTAGKSTLASAMYDRGHTVVSDDLTAVVDLTGERATVASAFPRVKVNPDVAEHLDLETAGATEEALKKGFVDVSDRFREQTYPLAGVYLVSPGPPGATKALPPADASAQLLRHSYVTGPDDILEKTDTATEHFERCSALADRTPVSRLGRTDDLADLPAVASAVEDEVGAATTERAVESP